MTANEGDHILFQYDGRDYNGAHRIDATLDFVLKPEAAVSLAYSYPTRPELDSTWEGRVSPTGGWISTVFPCPHILPDDRNVKCQTYRGGYGSETDLDGPFFGYTLLAGLPVAEDGTVTKTFRVGLRPLTVYFHAEDLGDTIAVSPSDHRSRLLPLHDAAAREAQAVPCGIFSGRLIVEKSSGVPLSCEMVSGFDGFRPEPVLAWSRAEHRKSTGSPWGFVEADEPGIPGLVASHAFPPKSADDGLPFGFWEALSAAMAQDEAIAAMMENPSTWTPIFVLFYETGMTGVCPACIKSIDWKWNIELRDGISRVSFTVVKKESPLTPYETTTTIQESDSSPVPRSFSAGALPLGFIWQESADLRGFSPISFGCEATPVETERFVAYTDFAEAFCAVGFNRPPTEGPVSPSITYRSDGSLLIFEANGAVADPNLEG